MNSAFRLGYYASILTVALTLVTFVIAVLTPPLSGPLCVAPTCFDYPFIDIDARFPRDYLWMYPAMALSGVLVALLACIHEYAPAGKKVYSRIAFSLALFSSAVLIIDYFLQVSVIPSSLVNGETEGIALLTQYNPHGIFIALEELGYLSMGLSLFSLAPVFKGRNKVERALRWIFILGFFLTLLAFVAISILHGNQREYRFELAVISIDWLTLILAGILLSVVFKRAQGKS